MLINELITLMEDINKKGIPEMKISKKNQFC